jgi:lipopolysaccharide export system permease protein
MSILYRFIAKEWLKSFVAAVIVLLILVAAADIINGFLRNKGDISQIFINFFIKLPDLMSKMLPISTLIASLFCLNKLKTHSELVAILATGMSPIKIILVISFCASLITGFQLLNTGYLIPYTNKINIIDDDEESLIRSQLEAGKVWYKGNNYFATFAGFDPTRDEIIDLAIFFHTKDFKSSNMVMAKKARYQSDNNWLLIDGIFYSDLDTLNYPKVKPFQDKIIQLGETPSDFKKFESDVSTLNLTALYNYVDRLKLTGINVSSYSVMFWDKISMSYICLLFALMPLLSIYNPNRRSSSFGKNILYTLLFTIFYWLAHTSLVAMGNNGQLMAPLATMSIPIAFSFFLIFRLVKLSK